MSSTGAVPGGGLTAMAGNAPPTTTANIGSVAGAAGGGSTAAAPGSSLQAGAGTAALGGGGDFAGILQGISDAIASLSAALAQVGATASGGGGGCGGGGAGVMGERGGAATTAEYVAPVQMAIASDGGEDHEFEAEVLRLINEERAKAGLAAVGYNGQLDNAAEKHATHMSVVGRMAHDGIGDGDPGERIRAEGWSRAWGENVATGQTSPAQVVAEWMASPTHRKNILDPSFTTMGVGYVTAANGRSYWAQEFGA